MKTIAIIAFLILPGLMFGQDFQLRKQIDSSVLAIEKGTDQILSFSKTEKGDERALYDVKYQFKGEDGNMQKIVRQYENRDSSVAQVFYTINSSLIFSTESVVSYYRNDSIEWRATYYFSNGKLADFETLGHGKSEISTWNPENEVFRNYQRAKSAVHGYLRTQRSGQSRKPRN
jgi:hypothetical protein